jgi:LacI family transcriptional regulator
LAVTVVSELLRLGYRIPEDVTVVGFGDFSSAQQISPSLTTVRLRGQDMGATCVRQLDDRLRGRGNPDVPLRVLVASTLVVRHSSGPAPGLQAAPTVAGGSMAARATGIAR